MTPQPARSSDGKARRPWIALDLFYVWSALIGLALAAILIELRRLM
jgi:hypothetical protein